MKLVGFLWHLRSESPLWPVQILKSTNIDGWSASLGIRVSRLPNSDAKLLIFLIHMSVVDRSGGGQGRGLASTSTSSSPGASSSPSAVSFMPHNNMCLQTVFTFGCIYNIF